MKLLQNTRMTVKTVKTVKTLVWSLCCCLQRARSDETDLKITISEIISIFSHVFLLYLELPTTASAIHLIIFQQNGRKEKRGMGQFSRGETCRKTVTTVSIENQRKW